MTIVPLHLRRSGYMWRSPRLWRRRLIFWLGAVVVGLAAAGFAAVSDWAQAVFAALRLQSVWWASAATIAGFILCAEITRRFVPGARGSGIPQAIAARRRETPAEREPLLGLKVTAAKIFLTLLGLLAGASIGREGPTVQIGASIMFLIGNHAGLRQRSGLVLAGAAAGVAGAFNTPLAGIVFAIEELAKSYDRRVNALVVGAVVIAGITSVAVAGNYHYYGTITGTFELAWYWTAVPVCALFGGICGGAFSAVVVHIAFRRSQFARFLRSRPVLFAAGCGLLVAALGLATQGYVNGTGYHQTREILETGTGLPWWYAFAKLTATLLSSISGIPGGLFSPSLSVGAALGQSVTWMLPDVPGSMIFLLMMAAYFAAVVQAPLTAFVILLEMTAETSTALPLMAVALIAAAISRLISPVPIYHALSRTF
jgi:H+/Cl- antiporter ClcA